MKKFCYLSLNLKKNKKHQNEISGCERSFRDSVGASYAKIEDHLKIENILPVSLYIKSNFIITLYKKILIQSKHI